MQIVITTPTGNIGSPLARTLLDRGASITVIARDAAKVQDLADRGARVVLGSHGDAALLTEATRDAAALFVLSPPDWQIQDIRAHYRQFGAAAAQAIEANHIPHVVHLSSVGADLPEGTGPVVGLYEVEQQLNATTANVAHLRPAYFMENTLGQIGAIAQAGSLFTTFDGDTRFPMIATADIAARAADLLDARDWTGTRIVELMGAEEVSYNQVAAALSEVLGKPLAHVTVTAEQQRDAMIEMGASAVLADSFHELAMSVQEGRVQFHEERGAANTTPTTYPEFAQQVFKGAYQAATN